MAPVVYSNWDILKSKLADLENIPVNKRVGNKTIVFRVQKLKYDPRIPVLKTDHLERWLTEKKTNPIDSPALSISTSDDENDNTAEAICEGQIDKLVITEDIEDEYRCLEDEEETDFFKGKRRTRPDPPKPPPPPQPYPSSRPLLSQHDEQILANNSSINTTDQNKNKSKTATQNGKPAPEDKQATPSTSTAPPPVATKQPSQANWTEISHKLDDNKFSLVYIDLSHYRNQLNSSDEGKKILKSAILKCITEDETKSLIDYLKLLFALDYEEDCAFWAEVLPRINRKLSNHSQIRVYKAKTNPEWVFANYQSALALIRDYAKRNNRSLLAKNVSMASLITFIDPYNNYEILEANPNKEKNAAQNEHCQRPMSIGPHNQQVLLDRKLEIKKEIKAERQENTNPANTLSRQVEQVRTDDGKPTFRITFSADPRPKSNGAQRLRL